MGKKLKASENLLLIFILTLLSGHISFSQSDKSFLNPPQIIKNPSLTQNYTAGSRKFTGIPSLAVSPKGRLWAVWYTGITPGEDRNNYVVVATSGDLGKTWEEVLAIDPDGPGPVRAFDPEVWIDPDGKLWIFWAQSIEKEEAVHYNGINTGVWSLIAVDPESGDTDWSEAKRLTDGIMMCKPLVLSGGEWLLPASTWRIKNGARVVVSTDNGRNWSVRGAVDVPEAVWNCDEHMIVERKDKTLWMLVRTRYGIGESTSNDQGRTWSPLLPSKIQHPTARFFIRRLYSGNLLLVKHGPIDLRTGRSHLMAFISKDDGYSWSGGLLLDERLSVSYPDGQQTADGTIYIIYDYDRTGDQNILMTSFIEEDIVPCSDIKMVEVFGRRLIISRGGLK